MTIWSGRSGDGIRPWVTATRSWVKSRPLTLATGYASPVTPSLGDPSGVSGAPVRSMAGATWRTPGSRAIAAARAGS